MSSKKFDFISMEILSLLNVKNLLSVEMDPRILEFCYKKTIVLKSLLTIYEGAVFIGKGREEFFSRGLVTVYFPLAQKLVYGQQCSFLKTLGALTAPVDLFFIEYLEKVLETATLDDDTAVFKLFVECIAICIDLATGLKIPCNKLKKICKSVGCLNCPHGINQDSGRSELRLRIHELYNFFSPEALFYMSALIEECIPSDTEIKVELLTEPNENVISFLQTLRKLRKEDQIQPHDAGDQPQEELGQIHPQ